jgi:large exoprotein involved in heme utilization and adhesion
MQRQSLISTTAYTTSSAEDGGNITITTPVLVASPLGNSDIAANALRGSGGEVKVNASGGIYGLVKRSRAELAQRLHPDSPEELKPEELNPFRLSTNDITAFGDPTVDEKVTLNTPDDDLSRGLTSLPLDLTDASRLIVQQCSSSRAATASEFIVTGRGGLPPAPSDQFRSASVITPWVSLEDAETQQSEDVDRSRANHPTVPHASNEIVEAQGWIRDKNGTIVLVAHNPGVAPPSFWSEPNCDHSQLPTSTYGAQ